MRHMHLKFHERVISIDLIRSPEQWKRLFGDRRQGQESVSEYSASCIDMRTNEILISAESGFRQRASRALRPISSSSAAPAVTGVLCPDVPGGRSGVLFAHVG